MLKVYQMPDDPGSYFFFSGDWICTLREDNTAEITQYRGSAACVDVPETLEGLAVTRIGDEAFSERADLLSVTLPRGVTVIGNKAFSGCLQLVRIAIPDTVVSIGNEAFLDCFKLSDAYLPDSVTDIGEGAFCWCESLLDVVVPGGVTELKRMTYYGCIGMTSISLPEGLRSIGSSVIVPRDPLTVALPESLTFIADDAFDLARNKLHFVTVPGYYADQYCSKHSFPKTAPAPQALLSEGDVRVEINAPVLRAILDAYPYEIVFVDRSHTVRFLNAAARRRYGKQVVIGASLFNCHNEGTKPKIEAFLRRADAGANEMFETLNGATGEREFFVPVRDDNSGVVIGYFERHEAPWSPDAPEAPVGDYWKPKA